VDGDDAKENEGPGAAPSTPDSEEPRHHGHRHHQGSPRHHCCGGIPAAILGLVLLVHSYN